MPAQVNATVTIISAAGTPDDWDRAAAAGIEKWSGEARAYYRERAAREPGAAGAENVYTKRELIVDVADVLEMELDTDDVITFTVDGRSGTFTGTARTIPTPQLAGVPRALQTSRIILEDA